MSETVEAKGKTVSEAVSEALLQLGLRRDEVDITVLQEPKPGLLGFIGSRPAKVSVTEKTRQNRGRGRGRSDDSQAHSLSDGGGSRGGRGGRGGRGRGGRGGRGRNDGAARNDGQRDGQRDGRRDGQQRGGRQNEAPNRETRDRDSQSRDSQSRDNQGRSDQSTDSQNRNQRQGKRPEEPRGQRQGGDGGRRRNGGHDGPTEPRRDSNRGGRSRRNQADNTRPQVAKSEPSLAAVDVGDIGVSAGIIREESNSPAPKTRRGGRGRGGLSRKRPAGDDVSLNTANQEQEEMNLDNSKPVSPPVEEITPVVTETADLKTEPQAEPVAKPKAKRGGRGGSLGSRLATKRNPNVVEKSAPVASQPSSDVGSGSGQSVVASNPLSTERGDSSASRSYRPAEVIDEVIAQNVSASRYAKAIADVTEENMDDALKELAAGLLARAGFVCEVAVKPGDYREVRVSSDDEDSAGLLIGRHGQMVDAVEHLVDRMASNAVDDRVHMNLDINDYRSRRQESLAEQVAEAIAGVRESGKPYHVESMSPRERRLVHLEAENVEGIRTYTMSGSNGKHVVIALDGKVDDGNDETSIDDSADSD